jgi:hypothetical protein
LPSFVKINVITILALAGIVAISRHQVDAANPDFRIKELMVGANGDSRVQFLVIEHKRTTVARHFYREPGVL